MHTQYETIFVLPENLYVSGAPVLIAAGTLETGERTRQARITLQSLSPREIRSVTVSVQPRSGDDGALGSPLRYRYSHLAVSRGGVFGGEIPLLIKDRRTRRISVSVEEVLFADQSCWYSRGEPWQPLHPPRRLAEVSSDEELLKQYQLTFGPHFHCIYWERKDLWYCGCGALNTREENTCFHCGTPAETLKQLDWHGLRREKEERLLLQRQKAEEKAAMKQVLQELEAQREAQEKAAREERQREAREKAAREGTQGEVQEKAAREEVRQEPSGAQPRTQEAPREPSGQKPEKPPRQRKRAKPSTRPSFRRAAGIAAALLLVAGLTALAAGGYFHWKQSSYDRATALMASEDQYGEALAQFESLGGFRDSDEKAQALRTRLELMEGYERALQLMENQEDPASAAAAFEALGDFRDSRHLAKTLREEAQRLDSYRKALALLDQGQERQAKKLLDALGDYRDSRALSEALFRKNPLYFAEIGDVVTFGTYEQDNINTTRAEFIHWVVVDRQEDRVLLLSEQFLDYRPYHNRFGQVPWADCSLRSWLNGEFYRTAFSTQEKEMIQTTLLANPGNPEQGIPLGNDTQDKVFLLSLEEAQHYQNNGLPGYLDSTPHAVWNWYRGTYQMGSNCWWLRSAGTVPGRPAYIWDRTIRNEPDNYSCNVELGVRPAIWVRVPDPQENP